GSEHQIGLPAGRVHLAHEGLGERLDHGPEPPPPTSSWPSGHVSAAVCFYGGLAVLLAIRLHGHRVLSGLVWAMGAGLPLIVAASRLYRGMHYVTDVVWGLVLGVFCLAVMIRQVLR
ncbi:phosphatase PAP2 family protein, partial [Nonomuraea sp. NPDC055795]